MSNLIPNVQRQIKYRMALRSALNREAERQKVLKKSGECSGERKVTLVRKRDDDDAMIAESSPE